MGAKRESFRTLGMTRDWTWIWTWGGTTQWTLAYDIIVMTGGDEIFGADVDGRWSVSRREFFFFFYKIYVVFTDQRA